MSSTWEIIQLLFSRNALCYQTKEKLVSFYNNLPDKEEHKSKETCLGSGLLLGTQDDLHLDRMDQRISSLYFINILFRTEFLTLRGGLVQAKMIPSTMFILHSTKIHIQTIDIKPNKISGGQECDDKFTAILKRKMYVQIQSRG